jgi:hypothetical protein
MSEETTEAIAELAQLEWELNAATRTGPVQLVNKPIQPGDWIGAGIAADPNDTCQTIPHKDVVREKLRAGAKDEQADPADREAARQALKIMYRE